LKIVIALGGNAIERPDEKGTYSQMVRNVRMACESISKIVKDGHEVVLTHGNGPQVGNLLIQQEMSNKLVPSQPLDVLGAMTQGQIGYLIQRELDNVFKKMGIKRRVVSVITQTLVNKDDPAFKNPSKPIGPFYSEGEIDNKKLKEGNYAKVLHNGKYYFRRVVPSPDPVKIIEGDTISNLVEAGDVVIASGGGGIPVVLNEKNELEGIEAVIDKDLAAEKLAEAVGAERLLILTNVDSVKLNYGKENETSLGLIRASDARKYLEEGHFAKGSMGPKVLACIRFVEWGGKDGKIAHLEKAVEAMENLSGTTIVQ